MHYMILKHHVFCVAMFALRPAGLRFQVFIRNKHANSENGQVKSKSTFQKSRLRKYVQHSKGAKKHFLLTKLTKRSIFFSKLARLRKKQQHLILHFCHLSHWIVGCKLSKEHMLLWGKNRAYFFRANHCIKAPLVSRKANIALTTQFYTCVLVPQGLCSYCSVS